MKSLIQFFEESADQFGSNVYMWEKTQDKYEGTTYDEIRKQVYEFAAGLICLGIRKGDRLSLISEGRNSWVVGELGILYAGAINVPLTQTDSRYSSGSSFRVSNGSHIIHQAQKLIVHDAKNR